MLDQATKTQKTQKNHEDKAATISSDMTWRSAFPRPCFFFVLFVFFVAVSCEADNAPDFNTHVLPILNKYCSACHNVDDASGKLVLDNFDQLMKGGEKARR